MFVQDYTPEITLRGTGGKQKTLLWGVEPLPTKLFPEEYSLEFQLGDSYSVATTSKVNDRGVDMYWSSIVIYEHISGMSFRNAIDYEKLSKADKTDLTPVIAKRLLVLNKRVSSFIKTELIKADPFTRGFGGK
jgi:hypothetical protein